MEIQPLQNLGNLVLGATSAGLAAYQCLLARSNRPPATVTHTEGRHAIIAAHWEIGALTLALNAINNLAGRNHLLDKGLHPGIYRKWLGAENEEWRRYCLYHDDFQRHAYRLDYERRIAQSYYDGPLARQTQALKRLIEIDSSLRQILNGRNIVTLSDVIQLTAESLTLADKSIGEEFAREIRVRRVTRRSRDSYWPSTERPGSRVADSPSNRISVVPGGDIDGETVAGVARGWRPSDDNDVIVKASRQDVSGSGDLTIGTIYLTVDSLLGQHPE